MANVFDRIGDWMAKAIAGYINDQMGRDGAVLRNYYKGDHRPQLKTAMGKQDDNIYLNFVGLAVDRSVSRLFRGGLKFVLPDGATAQQEYLDKVWDLNKKEILLYQEGLHGAVYGTHYIKICPDELIDPYTNKPYPRLIPLDPEIIRIRTDPQDMNEVLLYQIRYTIGQTAHYEITRRADVMYKFGQDGNAVIAPPKRQEYSSEAAEAQAEAAQGWVVEEWEQSTTYAQLTMTSATQWEYDFPPILHAKNLPSLKSCYGDSDIDDAVNVQDKANFVVSNTGKIIKFHAHPTTIVTGTSAKSAEPIDNTASTMMAFPSPDAKVFNLEMQSDLASSRAFALDLRQSIFDTSREVDISSMADKLGALTNFGLQVLWSDAIDKNDTKRQLYGDFLLELNRRLLVLANYIGEASNPGSLQWGNPLPVNILEEMQADQIAQNNGWIDKEAIAKRYQSRYGKEWEDIQAALQDEQTQANQGNANIGSMILRNFDRGGGVEQGAPINNQQMNKQPAMNGNNRAA